jgi:hypothetical protein
VKGPGRRLEGDEVFRDEGMMRRSIARAVGREGLNGEGVGTRGREGRVVEEGYRADLSLVVSPQLLQPPFLQVPSRLLPHATGRVNFLDLTTFSHLWADLCPEDQLRASLFLSYLRRELTAESVYLWYSDRSEPIWHRNEDAPFVSSPRSSRSVLTSLAVISVPGSCSPTRTRSRGPSFACHPHSHCTSSVSSLRFLADALNPRCHPSSQRFAHKASEVLIGRITSKYTKTVRYRSTL